MGEQAETQIEGGLTQQALEDQGLWPDTSQEYGQPSPEQQEENFWSDPPDLGEPPATDGDPQEGEEPEPPPLELTAWLSKQIVEERRDWTRKPSDNSPNGHGRLYASDLGLALGQEFAGCTLAFWHKLRGAEFRDQTPGESLMRQVGDLVHDFVAGLIGRAVRPHGWVVIDVEKRVTLEADGETVGSRLDVQLLHLETGWRTVIDIKTKRGGAFKFLEVEGAKQGDVLQVQGYISGENADDGGLLYVDREGQNFMRFFWVDRADGRAEEAIRRLVAIRDNDTPPEPIGLKLKRNVNKGDDSLAITVPWQIEWCNMKECQCAGALPCQPPSGVIAKLKEKEGEPTKVVMTKAPEMGDMLMGMLKAEYPDVDFVLELPKKKD